MKNITRMIALALALGPLSADAQGVTVVPHLPIVFKATVGQIQEERALSSLLIAPYDDSIRKMIRMYGPKDCLRAYCRPKFKIIPTDDPAAVVVALQEAVKLGYRTVALHALYDEHPEIVEQVKRMPSARFVVPAGEIWTN